MNPYFWAFALYALWITPVTVRAGIRLERQIQWRIQVRLAGVVIINRDQSTSDGSHRKRLNQKTFRDQNLKRVLGTFRLERLHVYARLSFADAAFTALSYGLIRTVLDALARCGALPALVHGRIEADFHAQTTVVAIQGITSAHLGTLAIACARFAWAHYRAKKRNVREEQYAAASH